jgi:HTH-type transcriptional regulator/antitoxin HigA
MDQNEPKLFKDEPMSPGERLRELLGEKQWTQEELAEITGRSRQQIIDILNGERGISPEMAIALAATFKTTPDYWMKLDSTYRLSQASESAAPVEQRVRVFEFAPVKDMQRRGWIKSTKNVAEIQEELERFFGVESLDQIPEFPVATRRSAPLTDLTSSQRAWCFRARQLAEAIQVPSFDPSQIGELKRELRTLAAYPAEASRVPDLMRKYGIRFVVIEPLPSSKMDGAAFWLDENSPVIAVSLRFDRIDYFWFTLMHECAHIENKDCLSVDTDLAVEDREQPLMKDAAERRADEAAAASLIPPEEMDSFIRRVGPIYARPNIIQFAHRIKIHPGIIVGQLQHLAEMGFKANRNLLPKVREHIVSTALADGWGTDISPDSI